jgi:hypothetical protein
VIPTFWVPTRKDVPPLRKKPPVETGWLKENSNAIPLLQPGEKHVFSVPVLSGAVDPRGDRTCVPEDVETTTLLLKFVIFQPGTPGTLSKFCTVLPD